MSDKKVKSIKSAEIITEAAASEPVVDYGDKHMIPLTHPTTPTTPPQEKMQEQDKLTLELAKSRRETALAQAKEALAKNETADLAYKYIVLQLYMKYGLTAADAISENGDIVRNGALPSQVK